MQAEPTEGRLRSHAPWLMAAGVVAVVCAIVLLRPYDGALNRSAASGTQWAEHVVRVETALLRAEHRDSLEWIAGADQGFPPLIMWAAVPLGDMLGRHASVAERFGLLWMLVLVLATGWLTTSLADRRAGALAAALVATFPAVHGTALGFFYDLPMTAFLFLSAAVLLGVGPRRPALGGALAGLTFLIACTGKWTALTLAPPLVCGVLLVRTGRARPWAATGVAAAVAGLGAGLFLTLLSNKSLLAMAGTSYGAAQSGPSNFGATVRSLLFDARIPLLEAATFLPIRAALGAVGPALMLGLTLASIAWVVWSRAGLGLVAAVTLGDLLVIHRLFPALNDRWLIYIVPVLAIAAALGVTALPRGRNVLAAALVAVGLWGTWEFHHGDTHARASANGDPGDWNEWRGWSAASSTEPAFGWARADYATPVFLPNREALWNAIVRCRARDVRVGPGVTTITDGPWWRYRDTLQRLDSASPLRHIATLGGTQMTMPSPVGDHAAVVLLRHDEKRSAQPPEGWVLRAIVPDWRGAPAVGLWTPPGSRVCTAYDSQ